MKVVLGFSKLDIFLKENEEVGDRALILPTSPKRQINVSLRGGTTKQSAMLLPIQFAK
jgi:hypothetical protein